VRPELLGLAEAARRPACGQAANHVFAAELFQIVGGLVSPVPGDGGTCESPNLIGRFGGRKAS